jgi:hypothetical protein
MTDSIIVGSWRLDAGPYLVDHNAFELAELMIRGIDSHLPEKARGKVSLLQCISFVLLVRAVDSKYKKEQAA